MILKVGNYLFAHRFRIGDGRAEESIPFQASVETGPMVVPITSVRETPSDNIHHYLVSFTKAVFKHFPLYDPFEPFRFQIHRHC